MNMQANDTSILLLIYTASLMLLLLCTAFVYLAVIYRNRKNQQQLESLKWKEDLLSEHERYLGELSARLHHNLQQPMLHLRYLLRESSEQAIATLGEVSNELEMLNLSINLEYQKSESLSKLIEQELISARDATSIQCYAIEGGIEPYFADEVKIILFRIAREAIHNIAKHAMASEVSVSMRQRQGNFTLCISDNGIGMEREKIYGALTNGINNMRSRAKTIKASLSIRSVAFNGTEVVVQMKDRA